MKSLKEFIFELKDETYLSAAAKRLKHGKNVDDLIQHAHNKAVKDFMKKLSGFSWFEANTIPEKCVITDNGVSIAFTENLHVPSKEFDNKLFDKVQKDVIDTCKEFGKLVHSVRFYTHYSNEDPTMYITFLDRKNTVNVKSTDIMYHVTKNESVIDSIIKNGLKPQEDNNFSNSYTYKCVFALSKKSGIKDYLKMINTKATGYYVISFEAGDNIYFNDKIQNNAFSWNGSSSKNYFGIACFTLTDVSPKQIVSIDYYKGNKLIENVYTRD